MHVKHGLFSATWSPGVMGTGLVPCPLSHPVQGLLLTENPDTLLVPKASFLTVGKEWGRGGQEASDNVEIRTVSSASSEPGRIDKTNMNVQEGFRFPTSN